MALNIKIYQFLQAIFVVVLCIGLVSGKYWGSYNKGKSALDLQRKQMKLNILRSLQKGLTKTNQVGKRTYNFFLSWGGSWTFVLHYSCNRLLRAIAGNIHPLELHSKIYHRWQHTFPLFFWTSADILSGEQAVLCLTVCLLARHNKVEIG